MSDIEFLVNELEWLADLLESENEHSWASEGGIGDRVSGIQVVRNGQIIQEWHDESHSA